jgi:hypothetical protein
MNAKQQPQSHFDNSVLIDEKAWYEWLCITRQRVAMSQLLERYTPKEMPLHRGSVASINNLTIDTTTNPNAMMDDVIVTCSSWRAYVSATEAMLRFAREFEHAKKIRDESVDTQTSDRPLTKDTKPMCHRYIGGTGQDSIEFEFQQQYNIHHRGKFFRTCLCRRFSTCFCCSLFPVHFVGSTI